MSRAEESSSSNTCSVGVDNIDVMGIADNYHPDGSALTVGSVPAVTEFDESIVEITPTNTLEARQVSGTNSDYHDGSVVDTRLLSKPKASLSSLPSSSSTSSAKFTEKAATTSTEQVTQSTESTAGATLKSALEPRQVSYADSEYPDGGVVDTRLLSQPFSEKAPLSSLPPTSSTSFTEA